MKLDKGIVDRRIKLLSEEGVEFRVNTEVGKNFPTEKLRKDFDAIALCGAPPCRAICRSKAARLLACTSPWSSSPPTPSTCSTATRPRPV